MYPIPPHWPYCATGTPVAVGALLVVVVEVTAGLLVEVGGVIVVAGLVEDTTAADEVEDGGAGSTVVGATPLPPHTGGPGSGYAALLWYISNTMPGVEAVYAPGKETSALPLGTWVPDPVTVTWKHDGYD